MKGFWITLWCLLISVPLSSQVCGELLCNGGFDNPAYTGPYNSYPSGSSYNCWRTTAPDDILEIWPTTNIYGTTAYNGTNFLEMNANYAPTIYQDFAVSNYVTLSISFAHMGRAGVDTVQVSIGPLGGPYTNLGRWGDGTSWAYHTVAYAPPYAGTYRLHFTSIYNSVDGYNVNSGVGNFLDAVSVNANFVMPTTNSHSICAGNSTTLTASVATNFTWSTGGNGASVVVSPLVNTVYTVVGTIGSCTSTRSVTINVQPLPVISIPQPTYSICRCTSVNLPASGGLSYTWAPGGFVGNPYTASPTVNTTYTVTGISVQGCRAIATTSVLMRVQPAINFTNSAITCTSLGNSTVSATGATGPYSYTWTGIGQTGAVANNLNASTYTALVLDNGTGCFTSSTTSIPSLSPFTGSLNATASLTCNAVNTATANFTNLAGASPTLTYAWTNGSTNYTTASVSGLSAGTWTGIVTDALTACQVYSVFTITQPAGVSLSLTAASPTACVGTSVTINSNAAGGIPAYTYTWSQGSQQNLQSLTSSTTVVSQMQSGTYVYSLTITDANLCPRQQTISLLFVANPTLTVLSSSVCPLAFGSITINGANTYTVTNPLTNTNTIINSPLAIFTEVPNNANPLVQNSYSYSLIGSAFGCSASAMGSITVKPSPTVAIVQNSLNLCDSKTFSITASSADSYTWNGPAGFTSNTASNTLTNIQMSQAGVYNLSITAINGCTTSGTATLTVYPTPTLSAIGSTICTVQTITISASSVPGVTYLWNGPLSYTSAQGYNAINNPSVSQSGTYTVTCTSINGCTNVANANVIVSLTPTVTITQNTISICDSKTFTMEANAAASYTWTGPANYLSFNQSNTLTNIQLSQAGVYQVSITAINGCTATAATSLTVYSTPTLSALGSNACTNQTVILTSNSVPNVTYQWTGPQNFSALQQNTSIVNPALDQSGTYTVTCTSTQGCTRIATALVTVFPLPTVAIISPKNMLCGNEYLVLQSSTNTLLPVTYAWRGPGGFNSSDQNISFIPLSSNFSGNYSLTVTDQKGCVNLTTQAITVYAVPGGTLISQGIKGCAPLCADINFKPAQGSNAITEIKWQLENRESLGDSYSKCFTTSGTYTLYTRLRDTNNCRNTIVSGIYVYEKPNADFDFYPKRPIEDQEEIHFTNTSTGSELKEWNWHFINNDGYQSNSEHTSFLFPNAGTYVVAMVAKNSWGCEDTVIKTVQVDYDFFAYVPNAFTPNGDRTNDVFTPVVPPVKELRFDVYNRWGQRLFTTTNAGEGWDGTFNGQECKADVYAWKLYLRSSNEAPNHKQKEMMGEVTLIR